MVAVLTYLCSLAFDDLIIICSLTPQLVFAEDFFKIPSLEVA